MGERATVRAQDLVRAGRLLNCMRQELGERDFATFMRRAAEAFEDYQQRKKHRTGYLATYHTCLDRALREAFGEEPGAAVDWAFVVLTAVRSGLGMAPGDDDDVAAVLNSAADATREPVPSLSPGGRPAPPWPLAPGLRS
ncbi:MULTISPECIES: hypothetical protein [Streptomyces]|uniref:hypothetical protein n=1 Tax=Streptomyces TaxID=1883 RepID=UPI00345C0717